MWSSDDFISLSDFGQLMWVGLINYVDDNGVGKNNVLDIAADVFRKRLADDPAGTFQKITESLGEMQKRGMVTLYEADIDGKTVSLLFLTNWDRHQKISHPAKPRFPRPEADSQTLPKITEDYGNPPKSSALIRYQVSGNQVSGNRETREAEPAPQERADEDYPIEFEQFWTTYPRKAGKRKAFAAWRKARRKTNNTFLIAKASMYAADPNREPGYTLTPANWLDGEHWDDDPLPAKPEPTARPSPSAWNRSQANQDANAALIAHYAAEEAAENQSREGVLTC
nr:MAG: putative replisome organizer protein [Bacteriophage sp.]